ncbi:hypothetical protein TWF173_003350, partial [Orbilia oligospora]
EPTPEPTCGGYQQEACPTAEPTTEPTVEPTPEPTCGGYEQEACPTAEPTTEPTVEPTPEPTCGGYQQEACPTAEPTVEPTPEPTTTEPPAPTNTCGYTGTDECPSGPQPTLHPGNDEWVVVGCYTEPGYGANVLPAHKHEVQDLTVEKCFARCHEKGYLFAGVENGTECWCDNKLAEHGGALTSPEVCKAKACGGDSTSYCGGEEVIYVYKHECKEDTPAPTTTTAPPPGPTY